MPKPIPKKEETRMPVSMQSIAVWDVLRSENEGKAWKRVRRLRRGRR
jgi:hypothetical protein